MTNTSSYLRNRIPGLAWGMLAVLLAAFFLLVLSGSSAHASDEEKPPGTLASLIGQTVAKTNPIVIDVLAPVTTALVDETPSLIEQVEKAAATVVTPVAVVISDTVEGAVEKLPGPTGDIVHAVADTAADLLGTVGALADETSLSQLTEPLLELVEGLPVVGNLAQDSGILPLAGAILGILDETTGDVGAVIDQILPPVVDVLDPGAGDEGESASDDVASPAPIPPPASASTAFTGGAPSTSFVHGGLAQDRSGAGAPNRMPPAHAPPAPPASAHAPGGSPHDGARAPASPACPSETSERNPHTTGDDLPASPAADTDVAPD